MEVALSALLDGTKDSTRNIAANTPEAFRYSIPPSPVVRLCLDCTGRQVKRSHNCGHQRMDLRTQVRPGTFRCRGEFSSANNDSDSRRQNRPDFMQQFLKPLVRATRAGVITAELFQQLLIAVNHSCAAFHVRFRGIPAAALAGALKSRGGRGMDRRGSCAWCTSVSCVRFLHGIG